MKSIFKSAMVFDDASLMYERIGLKYDEYPHKHKRSIHVFCFDAKLSRNPHTERSCIDRSACCAHGFTLHHQ